MRSGATSTGSGLVVSTVRRRAIVAAHLLSESIWVYALGAVLGAVSNNGRGPLGWWSVVSLLAASYLAMRVLQLVRMPAVVAQYANALMAALAVYVAIAAQLSTDGFGVDLFWLRYVEVSAQPPSFAFIAIFGGLLGAGLWWRGGRLAAIDQPIDDLEFSFKMGLVALAFSAVVDMLAAENLNILPLMFVFFAASLTGLSIGHLRAASTGASNESNWFRTIGAVVGGVLIAGLLFTVIERFILSSLAGPASWVLNLFGTAVFYVIVLPLAYMFGFLVQGAIMLLNWLLGSSEFEPQPAAQVGQRLQEQREFEAGEAPGYLTYIEWTVVVLIVLVVLFFVGRAFTRRMVREEEDEEDLRESVTEDADLANDISRLLYRLLPDRFKRPTPRPGPRIPDGDPDVADVFRIYFGMLSLAEDSGYPRPPAETPKEYQSTLERVFPLELVRRVTAAFNRACYGHRAPPREQIDDMRLSLEGLAEAAE